MKPTTKKKWRNIGLLYGAGIVTGAVISWIGVIIISALVLGVFLIKSK